VTGVFVASLASGIWWMVTAFRARRAGILGRPMALFAGLVGALTLGPALIGVPWAMLFQIPLFIVLGMAFLRRAGGLAPRPSIEAAPA